MAYIAEFTCIECGQYVRQAAGSGDRPNTCGKCLQKKAAEDRLRFLRGLEVIPMEDRIRKLEAALYDHMSSYHAKPELRF